MTKKISEDDKILRRSITQLSGDESSLEIFVPAETNFQFNRDMIKYVHEHARTNI